MRLIRFLLLLLPLMVGAIPEATTLMDEMGFACDDSYLSKMLKKFDQDGDGYVDFNEFQQLWQFVAPVSTPADSASASSSSGPARAPTLAVG